jgi:hypothetical protein
MTTNAPLARDRIAGAIGTALVTALGFLPSASGAEVSWKQLVIGTNTLKNASVVQATPVDIIFKHDAGYLRMKLPDLPENLREQYPYDALKAESFRKQQTDARRLDAVRARESVLRQGIADLELKQEKIRATMRTIRGKAGTPDKGRMDNFKFQVNELERDKQVLQKELGWMQDVRLALQQQTYEPPAPPAPEPAPTATKKKRKK